MSEKSYNANDLKILEGLEAVRVRPGMYIGSTGIKGLHHILWEIVDNAIDEAANGYADTISVTLHADGSASVEDNGRGMPTDINTKAHMSGVELIFTKLHAGGKFDSENYAFSGGLHGVGASVTNALSSWLNVEVYRKTVFKMSFKSYYDKERKKWMCGIPSAPLEDTGEKTAKRGTYVRFMPDGEVFETIEWNYDAIYKRLKELAFLNKGVRIDLADERTLYREEEVTAEDGDIVLKKVARPAKEPVSFKFDGGLIDFVKYLNEDKTPLYSSPLYYSAVKDIKVKGADAGKIKIEFAVCHTKDDEESLYSFVNNICTVEGGYHETGFHNGLLKFVNDYARANGVLKAKDAPFIADDIKEGLTAVLTVKMNNVEFEGQTKTKLGNPEAKKMVEDAVTETLKEALGKAKKEVIDGIFEKAAMAAKARESASNAKDVARKMNTMTTSALVGKLAACTGKRPELNELYIVEGDSAGGSAKQGRDRRFQAILPLRGKVLNAEKSNINKLLENEELRTLINALGTGVGNSFDISKLKYNKVIILADADQDGAHIRALLLSFFFRYMRELVVEGHVYIGMPPLYKIEDKSGARYAYDDEELRKMLENAGRGYTLQRYKGLGEMNPEQLWETTLSPQSRTLMRVTVESAAEAESMVILLMGTDSKSRKDYIFENANFNRTDKFKEIKG